MRHWNQATRTAPAPASPKKLIAVPKRSAANPAAAVESVAPTPTLQARNVGAPGGCSQLTQAGAFGPHLVVPPGPAGAAPLRAKCVCPGTRTAEWRCGERGRRKLNRRAGAGTFRWGKIHAVDSSVFHRRPDPDHPAFSFLHPSFLIARQGSRTWTRISPPPRPSPSRP